MSVDNIFKDRPERWGFRGDPYLWDDLEKHFENFLIPMSVDSFQKEFFKAFQELTEASINSNDIFVPRYNHGGMSSGMISSEFWKDVALPLLTERLRR